MSKSSKAKNKAKMNAEEYRRRFMNEDATSPQQPTEEQNEKSAIENFAQEMLAAFSQTFVTSK